MKNEQIKYRQRTGDSWHYWGFIDGVFVAPIQGIEESDQYTGLKDKNGKEIYEGDCLKNIIFKDLSSYEGVYEVYFENGCFGIGMGDLYRVNECEIIGNIHENPELLNQ